MSESIYDAAWEEILPENLTRDPKLLATVRAIAEEKRKIAAEIWKARLWLSIQRLPEEALDALAYDLKVDWYDYEYSLEEKRRTILDCFRVHRYIGTKYAVEQAIGAIWSGTAVQEWWEYGAEPFHFRIVVDADFQDDGRSGAIIERAEYYKNVRSVFDGIIYLREIEMQTNVRTGFALKNLRITTVSCGDQSEANYLTDESGNILLDEFGNEYVDG